MGAVEWKLFITLDALQLNAEINNFFSNADLLKLGEFSVKTLLSENSRPFETLG